MRRTVSPTSVSEARAKGNYERSDIAGRAIIATLNPTRDTATALRRSRCRTRSPEKDEFNG